MAMDSPSPSYVILAYDATKARTEHEFGVTLNSVQTRGDIIRKGDTILVVGVLHKVPHPMGYNLVPSDDFSSTSTRAMEEEVKKKIDAYVNMLLETAQKCEDEGVSIEVKITAGNPVKHVILQEAIACKATWVILDRHLRRELRFYRRQIPCKVGLIQDNLTVDVIAPEKSIEKHIIEHKLFYSKTKAVPSFVSQGSETIEHPFPSGRTNSLSLNTIHGTDIPENTATSFDIVPVVENERSGIPSIEDNRIFSISKTIKKQHVFRGRSTEAPILCAACGTRTELLYIKDSMGFSFSEIQHATNDFSQDRLIGEGGYGYVYKGQLKDGQLIAAKIRKEASSQGFTEFQSEIDVLSFARHKNIVMLLGYCCKENHNILVYEYICNNSLDWHLFDTSSVLEWHRRYAIAIGTAKGLRFLHEECRGGPIIHRDMRPSNILLTHDFVPMLGDFGLAKWKITDPVQTRILGTLGYVAPEYAENGTVSIRTDVYAFGIVLLQLISARKAVDLKRNEQEQSLREWAETLIEKMELHELIDPRLGDSYDTYELYVMAKAANLCIKRNPELRPSMGEVVRILEGKSDHFHSYGESSYLSM